MSAASDPRQGDRRTAHDLSERSGIPYQAALRVVRAEATIQEVLRRLLSQDIRRRLEGKGMEPSLAGQVANGRMDEDAAWDTMRAMDNPDYEPERSFLQEAKEQRKTLQLELFQKGTITGRVREVTKYELTIDGTATGEQSLFKHDLKWAAPAGATEHIQQLRQRDEEVEALKLSSSTHLGERLRLQREQKLSLLERARNVRLVFRDGDVLVGELIWASRYELGVRLVAADTELVVFIHALLRLQDGQTGEKIAEAEPLPPGSARPVRRKLTGRKGRRSREAQIAAAKEAARKKRIAEAKEAARKKARKAASKKVDPARRGGRKTSRDPAQRPDGRVRAGGARRSEHGAQPERGRGRGRSQPAHDSQDQRRSRSVDGKAGRSSSTGRDRPHRKPRAR